MHAAIPVKVTYEKESHQTDIFPNHCNAVKHKRKKNYSRGSKDAFDSSAVKIEVEYTTPIQVHNPMKMHAATVSCEWTDGSTASRF